MKIHTINIRQRGEEWECTWAADNKERVNIDHGPHSAGWYHCPQVKGVEVGFEELKSCMIKAHEFRIKELQKGIEKLKALQFPK